MHHNRKLGYKPMNIILKTSLWLSIVCLGGGLPSTSHAQILKKVTDKAKEVVEQRQRQAERKVDNTIDRTIDEALEKGTDLDRSPRSSDRPSGHPSLFGDIKTESQYNFTTTINYNIKIETKGKAARSIDYELLYHRDEPYSAVRVNEYTSKKSAEGTTVIYDVKNQCMIILSEDPANRMSMAMPWSLDPAAWQEYKATQAPPRPHGATLAGFESIGTKTIAGFESQGYLVRDEGSIVEVWMSDEFAPELQRMLQQGQSSTMLNTFMPSILPGGMLLELRSNNLRTGEVTVMSMTGIDTKKSLSWRMRDYPRKM
jgi:hypothetical protein